MAQNIVQQQNRRPAKVRKLRLASLFTDAPVRIEPEEEKKVVVAGLVEASPNKEYPDEYFKRAWAVFRGEFATLFKSALWFFAFTIPFIVIFAWFAKYFENMVLGGTYNFMGDIGVGFPGGGDSIAVAVARLYWEVKTPVLCMLAGTLILGSLGLGGIFYCTKRSYYQDHYKRITKTFWMGFAKFWWKYLVTMTFAVLIGTAMGVSLLYFFPVSALFTVMPGMFPSLPVRAPISSLLPSTIRPITAVPSSGFGTPMRPRITRPYSLSVWFTRPISSRAFLKAVNQAYAEQFGVEAHTGASQLNKAEVDSVEVIEEEVIIVEETEVSHE